MDRSETLAFVASRVPPLRLSFRPALARGQFAPGEMKGAAFAVDLGFGGDDYPASLELLQWADQRRLQVSTLLLYEHSHALDQHGYMATGALAITLQQLRQLTLDTPTALVQADGFCGAFERYVRHDLNLRSFMTVDTADFRDVVELHLACTGNDRSVRALMAGLEVQLTPTSGVPGTFHGCLDTATLRGVMETTLGNGPGATYGLNAAIAHGPHKSDATQPRHCFMVMWYADEEAAKAGQFVF